MQNNTNEFLAAGTSWYLGAPVIRFIPLGLKQSCEQDIKTYFGERKDPSYEDLFNCLHAERFIKTKKAEATIEIDNSIKRMQKWLFDNCNTEKTKLNITDNDRLNKNRYQFHETFVKRLLQKPNNLKRANLFTPNYDMAFDYALDNLGIHYINGFMRVHNRCLFVKKFQAVVHFAQKLLKKYSTRVLKKLRLF